MSIKRVFIIVLDSVGIGEMPDAKRFGDEGSNTVLSCFNSGRLNVPTLSKLGFFNIEGLKDTKAGKMSAENPAGAFARMTEKSNGKDTTIGHWEIAGVISQDPMPTYPYGFPNNIIKQLEAATGRKVLCNQTYSGTKVIVDYGEEHIKTGGLIVYTSADSVMQIAAHEDVILPSELYEICKTARKIMTGKDAVGRIIARPFDGSFPDFKRTSNRHDFSLKPPRKTMLDFINKAKLSVIGVGKISDIFAGEGITKTHRIIDNSDGMKITREIAKSDFKGLCFVNLVDFDMVYGHRNDIVGYTNALNIFDKELSEFLPLLNDDDILMITADHGCDPATPSTDHSREYTPLVIYGKSVIKGTDLKTRKTFADIGKTVCDIFNIENNLDGESFLDIISK